MLETTDDTDYADDIEISVIIRVIRGYYDGLTTMNTKNQVLKLYRVRVGHWEIRLKAHDADEAIELARRQMARELPRLYDVIKNLTPARFQVEAAA
jgi:predicted pyridoxine 5'-phosphate oxidase superfamily flavin-nucleotide-binding protein